LYLNPPENAIVLCMDEKSSVQALDRSQPSLPMVKGRAATMTHDYKRNGTTTLFAALEVLTGTVIGSCLPKHRHSEFLKFLKVIDAQVPAGVEVHLILDNYATHKHPNVRAWLAKHPRYHLHFTPTSSSWLNLVERWFRELAHRQSALSRSLPLGARSDRVHRGLPECSQRRPQTIRLDRHRRGHPRQSRPRPRRPTSSHSKLRHTTSVGKAWSMSTSSGRVQVSSSESLRQAPGGW